MRPEPCSQNASPWSPVTTTYEEPILPDAWTASSACPRRRSTQATESR